MGSKAFRNLLLLMVSCFFCLGFKVFPGVKGWGLDTSTAAGRKVFISFEASGKTIPNDLPSGDPLAASGANLTEMQILQSVINDYNNIQRSNLILALDTDSDFAAHSKDKRIEIEQGDAVGESSGEAQPSFSGKTIIGCKIVMTEKSLGSAKFYVNLLTHEIGHCLGLDHPQETVWSAMSYFYNEEAYRLAVDDKMGIVFLYAKNSSDAQEKPTLGMSCARQ